ncbi:MAG: autotransporter-associated beta strand repeat-containing protein [Planctomycetia bacterium]|nr:autotransporter-associated beta strand repeat-containing protein [Planctomycetia bacterium]
MSKKRLLSLSHIRRKLLFGCVLGILPMGQAWSQDTTWTGAANSNWDLVSSNWSGLWQNGQTAIFAGANQNPITVSPVSAFGISFTSGAYTLNSGTITLVSGGSSASGLVAGEIRVATGLTANINSVLAGSVGMTKTGLGSLVLSGNNTYSGGTTITGGTLQVGNGSNTGSLGSGTATINSGTTLRYFRNDQHTLTTSFTGTGTLNFIGTGVANQSSYILTGINNSSLAGTLQVGSPGGNGARVVVNNQNQLGTAAVTVNSGSQIFMQSGTYSNNFTLNGIGWLEGANSLGALRMDSGSTVTGSVTLAGNSRIGTSSSATVSGVISGGFALEKTLTGTLTLSGNNTYTGGTSLSAGTLSVSSNSNLGNAAGGLTFNGGTLQVNGTSFTNNTRSISWGATGGGFDIANAANTFTVSQNLGAGGSLTKLGAGSLVLSGANTYTGGVNLNAGTLSVGADNNLGAAANALTFNGGTLQTTGTFTTARGTTLNAPGGSIDVASSTTLTHSGLISGAGGLTKLGAGTLILSGANTYTGGTTLAGTAGSTVILGNPSALGANTNSLTVNAGNTLDLNGQFAGDGVSVGTLTGTGTIINNHPSFGANLSVGQGNVSSTFAGSLQDAGASKPLNLNKVGTGTLTLTGNNTHNNTIISGGILSVASSSNLGATGSLKFSSSGSTLQITGSSGFTYDGIVYLTAPGTVEITDPANTITFSWQLVNSGSLTKAGPGTLTLTNTDSTYSGGTFLNGGTLSVSSNINLGSTIGGGGGGALTFNGGTLQVTGTSFTNNTRSITWGTNGGGFDIANAANTFTVSQNLGAGGSLTKLGAGTLVLSGANTYTGGTNLNAGILRVAGDGNLGNSSGGLTFNGGTLQTTGTFTTARGTTLNAPGGSIDVASSTTLTHSGLISGAGGLTKLGAGTLILSGANTYNGGTNLAGAAGSTVILGNASALGAGTNSLTVNAVNTLDVNGLSVNVGALAGTGTIINNPATNVGGILRVGNGNVSSTFDGTLQDGSVSKPLTLNKLGSGTLTLTGNNTHSVTQISGGILSVSSISNMGAGTGDLVFLSSVGTLQITGSSPFTYSGGVKLTAPGTVEITDPANTITFSSVIQHGGSLTKAGPGKLVLTNSPNSYSGGTIFAGGTLSVSSDGNLGLGGLTFNGGTLQVTGTSFTNNTRSITWGANGGGFDIANAANTFTVSQALGAGGSLTKLGAGTLVLSGANTYTGGTNLNAGILSVAGDGNLGNSGDGLNFNGGILRITGTSFSNNVRPINWGGNGGGFDIASAPHTFTVSQALTAGGNLTKSGAGTLVLANNNSYTGTTTVSAGTLQVGNAAFTGSLGAGLVTINPGATLRYYRNDLSSFSTTFSGNGTLNYFGTGNQNESTYLPTGNNSGFTGTVQVGNSAGGNGARVAVTTQNQLGAGPVVVNTGSQVYLQSGTYANNFTINGNGWLENSGNLGALRIDAGSTITGSVTLAGNSRIGSSTTASVSGVISGGFSLEKVSSGTLTLSAANTYTGPTTVIGGALIINGNQSAATGDYTVNAGATLGGSGIVGKLVNFNGGTVSPGNPGDTGILTINGGINFNAGSSFRVELQGSVVGTGYDQLILNSTTQSYVMVPGIQLIGDRLGTYQANFLDSFMILKGSNLGIGTFAGLSDGALFNFDGQVFQIRYNVPDLYTVTPQFGITWTGDDGFGNYGADNGGNIVIAAVPEPGTWALILGTLSICGYVAYRRNSKSSSLEELVEEDC